VRDTVERLRRIEQQRQQQELSKLKVSNSKDSIAAAADQPNDGPNQRRRHHSMYTKIPSNLQDMEALKADVIASTSTSKTSSSSLPSNITTAESAKHHVSKPDGGGSSSDGAGSKDNMSKDNIITLGVDSHDINDRLRQLFNDDDEFGNTSFSQASPAKAVSKALSSSSNDKNSPNISSRLNTPIAKSIKGSDTPVSSTTTMDAKKNLSAFLMQRRGSA